MKAHSVSQELNNDRMLDIMKYVAAIMVIVIHCDQGNQAPSQGFANFFIQNIVCRIAVPFFLITSAYLVRKGSVKSTGSPQYVTRYLKKTMQSYLLWSLAFAPIGLDWMHQNLAIAGYLLPFAFIYGLLHIGTYYHLWYIPAMMISVFAVNKLLKYISYPCLFFISILLFVLGSTESYYGMLPAGVWKDLFDQLMQVIITTRSGLFYGMIFVGMGFYLYDYREKLKKLIWYLPGLVMGSAVLLIAEGTLLSRHPGLDMNFMLGLLPFSFFFFLWILSCPYRPKRDTRTIRELSKYYYFVHPVCIVIVEQMGIAYDIPLLSAGFVSFLLIVLFTHLISSCVIGIHKPVSYVQIFAAIFCGLCITGMLCGGFFLFKPADITVKFEFVPCVWFAASILISYVISKSHVSKKSKTSL